MDFAALKADLASRGFARFTDQMLGAIINDARAELDEMDTWPYREASVTGVAPLAIADLGEVEEVFDMATSTPLDKRSYRELVNDFGDVSATSACPWFWYRATPAGVPTVGTYPVSTGTVGVQYWRVTPLLVDDADVPIAPARFHSTYVLIGERMSHARKGDQVAVVGLQAEVDRKVMLMRDALLPDNTPAGQIITGAGSCDW